VYSLTQPIASAVNCAASDAVTSGESGSSFAKTKKPPEGVSVYGEGLPVLAGLLSCCCHPAEVTALTISVVESGDLVSGRITSPVCKATFSAVAPLPGKAQHSGFFPYRLDRSPKACCGFSNSVAEVAAI